MRDFEQAMFDKQGVHQCIPWENDLRIGKHRGISSDFIQIYCMDYPLICSLLGHFFEELGHLRSLILAYAYSREVGFLFVR